MAEEKLGKVRELAEFVKDFSPSLAAFSIAWCIKNPNVTTAILGATRKEQLLDNLKALEVLPDLSQEIMDKVDVIMGTKPVSDQV
jgi:aryl-alcohol dehydrogenase-like predicted oxidoreductase